MFCLYGFSLRQISSSFPVDVTGGREKNRGSTAKIEVQNHSEETVIRI